MQKCEEDCLKHEGENRFLVKGLFFHFFSLYYQLKTYLGHQFLLLISQKYFEFFQALKISDSSDIFLFKRSGVPPYALNVYTQYLFISFTTIGC